MPPDPEHFPFFVIANKVDLPEDQRMVGWLGIYRNNFYSTC